MAHVEASREDAVTEESRALKKELKTGDLVFAQLTLVVGSTWVGTAGQIGAAHVAYWALAAVFFFAPLAIVVSHLSSKMPLEGGLYQWAKLGLGEGMGFLVAWNYWVYTILIMGPLGLEVGTFLAYGGGESASFMGKDLLFVALLTASLLAVVGFLSVRGLRVGKWIPNLAGVIRLVVYAVLLGVPLAVMLSGKMPAPPGEGTHPVLRTPVFLLNIFGNMGFGAFSGFEYIAIFAGESKNPARAIGRSVIIAAPIVLLMFILGTGSVLAFVPRGDIDLIAPLPQAVREGARVLGGGEFLAQGCALLLAFASFGYACASFAGIARLPMVAGWDGLLPAWFTKLHPRYKTPVNSIAFIGVITLAVGLAGMAGVSAQEAYQLLGKAALICYALTYLAMFAIPIRAKGTPAWIRVASASGFAMTLLFIVLAVVPIVEVESPLAFTLKISIAVLVTNVVGVCLFLVGQRRKEREKRHDATTPRRHE